MGLEPFCSLNLSIYPNLIKEFLSIAIHHKYGFKGTIRGTEVVITSTFISDFLNFPCHDKAIYIADPKEEALNVVLDTDDSDPHLLISANDL